MKCPNCNETLLIAERHHVEIDYCPNCRGVWLDKGELDKLLDYSADRNIGSRTQPTDDRNQQRNDKRDNQYYRKEDDYRHDQHRESYGHGSYPKKKKSFLSDFFDFD